MIEDTEGTVLIVEDDTPTAVLQRRRLERAGYQVSSASTIEEALRAIDGENINLIVLDYRLAPPNTGLDFYEQLKSAGHRFPVIMVTGFSDEAVVVQALRAGIRDFVAKSPEYLDYLPEAVQRVLRQVRMEQKLAESEARLASIIGSAKDAILVTDTSWRIVLFNPAAEKMFGCPAAQALGQPLDQFMPRYRETRTDTQGPRPSTEETLSIQPLQLGVRADGTEFPLEATVSRSRVGPRLAHTIVARDITERRRSEARIREQAALLDEATDAIMVRDLDDCIQYWNRGAERIYGWSAAEAVGQIATDLFLDAANPEMPIARHQVVEKGEWAGEVSHRVRDGGTATVESRWTLVRDEAGQPKSVLVINTNVTEKKKLEAQYLRTQRMESLGTLAGGIAHDLNNVLTPILMGVDLLKSPEMPERQQALLETVRATAERGAALVQQILSFARGAPGQRLPLQLQPILKETHKLLEHSLPKSIELSSQIPTDLWWITGDATHICQVLMNLCLNARDAMPEGGRLTVVAENVLLDEMTARAYLQAKPGPYVLLQVTDTGVGMGPEVQEKMFDPFFTTKSLGKGTGLGLATVQGIVKGYGGFLNVYSEVGQGSRFSIYLPARQSLETKRAPANVPDSLHGHGELILVVDDEKGIRELARTILEMHGYRVLTAKDGADALSIYREQKDKIALVLLDMMMPVMDGPKALQAFRELDPGVRTLATSGLVGPAADLVGLGKQVAFLQKPYTVQKLLQAVQDAIGKK